MDPEINFELWSLFFGELMQNTTGKLLEKALGVEGEPKVDQIVADAYIAAVKEQGENPRTPLDEKIDKLALICRAMWELLRDKYDLSDEILLEKIKEIDLSDGLLDGKVNVPPKPCSKCGRPVSKRHASCIYCGAKAVEGTPFDSL